MNEQHHKKDLISSSNVQLLILILVAACFTLLLLNRIQNPDALSYGLSSQAASRSGCVQPYVSLNPTSIKSGEWVRVTGVVINCSTQKARLNVVFTLTDPAGHVTTIGSSKPTLGPSPDQALITTSATDTTAIGTYTVTLTVTSGGGSPAPSASATFVVQ